MKLLISILLILQVQLVKAQPPQDYDASCSEGISKAIADANSGNYYLVSYGLIIENPEWWHKQEFGSDYLSKNFNIHEVLGGCVVYEAGECYADTMSVLFNEKFGSIFFDSLQPIIDSLYKIHLYEIIVSDNFIPFLVDTMPIFDYHPDSLSNFIKRKIADSIEIPDGKVFIQFSVMKDGSAMDYIVKRGIDPYFDGLALEAVKTIKVIKPAVYYGKDVNVKVFIPITFVAEEKKRKWKK